MIYKVRGGESSQIDWCIRVVPATSDWFPEFLSPFRPISRPWWLSAGSVVASRSSQTGLRNPHPTSGLRTALPELRRRSRTPRAAYGLPSGASYWFPEFSAGRKAFGGALAG